jgi:hypothetical protein
MFREQAWMSQDAAVSAVKQANGNKDNKDNQNAQTGQKPGPEST